MSTFVRIIVILSMTFYEGQGQNEADIAFSVTEGFSNTFVGDLKNTTYLKEKFDQSILDNLVFNLLESTESAMFQLTGGVMRTAQDIDRESLSQCILRDFCSLMLDLSYSGPESLVGGFRVSVEIVDINDYVPRFTPDSIEVTFSEALPQHSSRNLDLAVDLDSPQHGVKRYELSSSGNTFRLESDKTSGTYPVFTSLRLVLNGELDREKIASYQLHIIAYDGLAGDESSRKGILTVTVQVGDDNDEAPTFTEESYELDIDEDIEPIKSLISVRALDNDLGENARVSYSWAVKTQKDFGELFSIHEESGDIYLIGTLDYETNRRYDLQAVAKDNGVDRKTATTDIIIHITDKNDNSPIITIDTLGADSSAQISESTPINAFVAQVSVSDPDSGNNGDIICSLSHPAFTLQAQSDTGYVFKVVTAETLDREVQELYALHITCTDQGEEQNQETKTLVVTVTDENDNRPELPKEQYVAYVNENNAVGDVLVEINATDKDKGDNGKLHYSISKGEISKLVLINEMTGVITANTVFDYENIKEIQFDVGIRDGGNPPYEVTTSVTIHIQDRNDERPVFGKNDYTIFVKENNDAHVSVGSVHASDHDSAPFNTFTYSIAKEYEDVPFYIHTETGEIFASNSFDRETKDVYIFVVEVTDYHNPNFRSEANVIISIEDVNDHKPNIVFPPIGNSTMHIQNDIPIGSVVLKLEVSDSDLGENANVTYTLQDFVIDGTVAFLISPSGTITTNIDLSDKVSHSFELVVFVQDKGDPPLSTSQKVVIIVDASADESGGGNISIIIGVTVVSVVIVAVLVAAILVIKLRERRRKNGDKNNEPYHLDRSDIIDKQNGTNDAQVEQGRTNQAYVIETGTPVSYNPLPPESRSRSVSPDSLMYEMKLDKVKAQKQYLAAMTGVLDHDTSSSGSTDDSGRGPSEEGGEYILRHSPLNDSSEQGPNDVYALPQKKASLKSKLSATSDTTDSSKNKQSKSQARIPPSYDSYVRRKASGRQKKVEFDLTERPEVQHYHSTGDLRSESVTDPEVSSPDQGPHGLHPQIQSDFYLGGHRTEKDTPPPPPRPPKRQAYDDMGFVFVNHHKHKLEAVHNRSHSYQDLTSSKPLPPPRLPPSATESSHARASERTHRSKNSDVSMASIVV